MKKSKTDSELIGNNLRSTIEAFKQPLLKTVFIKIIKKNKKLISTLKKHKPSHGTQHSLMEVFQLY